MSHQLALLNVARLVAPLDSPPIADFVANLDPVNAVADAAPGFVWRHQDDSGNSTSVRMLDDDMMIVNLAVWESIEALSAYAYGGAHREMLRRRREWFERMAEAYLVLWWVPTGHRPSVDEAEARLLHLRANGPSAHAFTFRDPFPVP
ncbi:MAG: hypothetical protein QOE63_1647 [Acidimicrobiaceae bacterium]